MQDQILEARLNALQLHLEHAKLPVELEKFAIHLENTQLLDKLWGSIYDSIRVEGNRLQANLGLLRDEEDTEKAWKKYAKLYDEIQNLFQECIFLISGLALRANELDSGICKMADELISEYAELLTKNTSLTVPIPKEILTKALARIIIRLRFPDWTIWALPLTAYEYGRTLLEELWYDSKDLIHQILEYVGKTGGFKGGLAPYLGPMSKPKLKSKEKNHAFVLFADAFATYITGPAYAYSVIILRFDPGKARKESKEKPADVIRAYVIFGVLRQMTEGIAGGSFVQPIEDLEKSWEETLGMVCQDGVLKKEEKENWQNFVYDAWKVLDERFPQVKYTLDGYYEASKWANDWIEQIKDKKKLAVPEFKQTSKIRDVLNASWLCYDSKPDHATEIAVVASDFFKAISQKGKSQLDTGSRFDSARGQNDES